MELKLFGRDPDPDRKRDRKLLIAHAVRSRTRSCRRSLAICITILCICLGNVYAKPFELYGLHLKGVTVSTVDSKLSEVILDGKSSLVAADRVNSVALNHIFSSAEAVNDFVLEELRAFVRTAFAKQDIDAAARAIYALSLHSQETEAGLRVFLTELSKHESSVDLFQKVLMVSTVPIFNKRISAVILLYAGARDPDWAKLANVAHAELINQEFYEEINAQFLEVALGGEIEQIARIVQFARTLQGPNQPEVVELQRRYEVVSKAHAYAKASHLESFYNLIDTHGSDPALKQILSPLYVDLLHHEASQRLREGKLGSALGVLTRVRMNKRTETTHRLVRTALSRLDADSSAALLHPQVDLMLRALAPKDERLKQEYTSVLERQAKRLLELEQFDSAQVLFERLVDMRPDPNADNDQVRIERAFALLHTGDRSRAQRVLQEVSAGIGLSNHIALFLYGYYLHPWAVLSLLLLPGIGICALSIQAIRSSRRARLQSNRAGRFGDIEFDPESQFEEAQNAEAYGHRAFRGQGQAFDFEEYRECLAVFDLEPGVTEREIKSAYRAAVKDCHPDLSSTGPHDRERFIRFTQTYNRLIELEGQRGVGDG